MNDLTFLKALLVEQKLEEEMMFSNATEPLNSDFE